MSFTDLTPKNLEFIFSRLDLPDLLSVGQVCHYFVPSQRAVCAQKVCLFIQPPVSGTTALEKRQLDDELRKALAQPTSQPAASHGETLYVRLDLAKNPSFIPSDVKLPAHVTPRQVIPTVKLSPNCIQLFPAITQLIISQVLFTDFALLVTMTRLYPALSMLKLICNYNSPGFMDSLNDDFLGKLSPTNSLKHFSLNRRVTNNQVSNHSPTSSYINRLASLEELYISGYHDQKLTSGSLPEGITRLGLHHDTFESCFKMLEDIDATNNVKHLSLTYGGNKELGGYFLQVIGQVFPKLETLNGKPFNRGN